MRAGAGANGRPPKTASGHGRAHRDVLRAPAPALAHMTGHEQVDALASWLTCTSLISEMKRFWLRMSSQILRFTLRKARRAGYQETKSHCKAMKRK